MPTRKTHAFLEALPDKHYGSFETVLLCEKPQDGSAAFDFDDVGNRSTAYHAMQIGGKAVHRGAREFRREGGRVQGRGHRGNGGRTSNGNNSSSNSNNSNGGINSNENSHGGRSAGSAQGVRGRGRGNQPSGRGRGRGQDGRNNRGRCRYCHSSTDHGWHNCSSASRMRLRMPRNRQMSCRSLLHDSRGSS